MWGFARGERQRTRREELAADEQINADKRSALILFIGGLIWFLEIQA
jgi:hypothetical protein